MDLKEYIRSIQDYPKKGILFRDITTLIKNEKAFTYCIDQIVNKTKDFKIDKIAAIESRGFVFASAVSYLIDKPFILLRKKTSFSLNLVFKIWSEGLPQGVFKSKSSLSLNSSTSYRPLPPIIANLLFAII